MALTVLVGFSACFAASEGLKATQAKSRKEEHRSRKNNLVVHCTKSSLHSSALEGRQVVLSGDKLYIDTGTDPEGTFGHPFQGYYLAYPDTKHAGLVSTITDEAPIMNWVYVDRNTHEVKFGARTSSEGHITGPFDCTRQDRRLTLCGWEGFVAVQEGDFWSLYFDLDDDRLKSKGLAGEGAVLDVELFRKEMRVKKPQPLPSASTTQADDGSLRGNSSSTSEESQAGISGSSEEVPIRDSVPLPDAPEVD